MMQAKRDQVRVFNGSGADFPCGVFSSRAAAEAKIRKYGLEGTLTAFPPNSLVYDWAISKGLFKPKRETQQAPRFIQRFTSAAQEHVHFERQECEP
nr:putative uncharacterized protein [uncultured bacterium]